MSISLAFLHHRIYNPVPINPDFHFVKRIRAARTFKTYLEMSDGVSMWELLPLGSATAQPGNVLSAFTLISNDRFMKRCPQCHRTYAEESFSFCLDDGALLSAPLGGDATLVLPNQQLDHLAPTLPAANRQPLPGGTRATPPAVETLPAMVSPQRPPPTVAGPVRKRKWLLPIAGCLVLGAIGVAVIMWFAVGGAGDATPNSNVSNRSGNTNTNDNTASGTNTNKQQDNKPEEKPTVSVRIGPFDYDYYGENLTETKWDSMPVTLISSAGRVTKNVKAGSAANIRSSYVQFDEVPCGERVTITISNSSLYHGAVPPVTLRPQIGCDNLVNLGRYKIKVVEVG